MRILMALVALAVAVPLRAQAPTDTLRLTLEVAVGRALAQSEEIRRARAQVAEMNGQVREAFAGALPQINGSITYTRQFASIFEGLAGDNNGDTSFTNIFKNSPFGAPNAWALELTASQLLFSAGKVGAGLAAAKSAREAARLTQQESATDIAIRTRQAYLDVQYRHRLLGVAGTAIDEARKQLRQVQLFHQAGTRAEYDLLRAQVDAANQEPAVVAAANDYEVALLELRRLINVPPEQPLALTTPLIAEDGTIPVVVEEDLAVVERPAVAAAEATVRVQQQLLRAAKAGDLPAMKLLLEHGADPTLAPSRSGINPLMAAAGLGTAEQDTTGRAKTQAQAIEAIQLLIDRGLDVNARAGDGQTAVHGAAMQGYDDVIKFLAAKGAQLDVPDKDGFTPLDVALGKAGGFGFSGEEGVVREGTAALLRELMATGAGGGEAR